MNLLSNPGFELGWWRKTHTGQEYGEIFVPEKWTAYWKEGFPVTHDPTAVNGYGRPEIHVINREAPYLNPLRVLEGNQALKLFTFYRIHNAGVYQQVTGITPGAQLEATGWAHAWSSNKDDPHISSEGDNFTFRIGIDPTGKTDPWADTVIWGPGANIYNTFEQIPPVLITGTAETVTVFVRSSVLWPFKHCDAYIDKLSLRVVDAPPPPPVISHPYPLVEEGTKLHPHGTGESGTYDILSTISLPYCKILAPRPENLLAIRNLKALSPNTKFIARLMNGSDPNINIEGPDFTSAPQSYMNSLLPSMREYPEVEYWELWNEQDPPGEDGHVRMALFTCECMRIAASEGFKLALMSYSTGVPENMEWQAIWERTDFFQLAREGHHILSLHAYCRSIYPEEFKAHLLRPQWLYENILIPNDCVVPFIFTEYNVTEVGHGGIWNHPEYPTTEALMKEYSIVDAALSQMYYCLGASLYQFGAGDDRYSMDKIWKPISEVMLSVRNRQNALPGSGYDRYIIMADPTYMNKEQLDMAYHRGRVALRTVTPSWNDAVQIQRPAEWKSNTVDAGPLPAKDRQKYLTWIWNRDPETEVVFDEAPEGFRQGNELWANVRLGTSSYTMRHSGCLVTATAEWMLQVDPTIDPLKLVTWLNKNNGFTADGRMLIAKPTQMLGGFSFEGYHTGAAATIEVVREILHRSPVIIRVDYDPGDVDLDSHFVLALEDLGDDLLVMDPLYGEVVSLMSLYGRGTLGESIFAVIDYRLVDEVPEPDPVPLLGFNDPNNIGAFKWLNMYNGESLVVIPLFLTGGPTKLHFDPTKVRVIINLRYSWSTDCGGGGTLPAPGTTKEQFISSCIETIKNSSGVWGWTIGNEANNPREFPHGFPITSKVVADFYNRIRAGVAGRGIRMSPGALDPFHASAGCPSVWLREIYGAISGAEFVAVHGYIRGPDAMLVMSDAKFTDDPLKWQYLNYVGCVTELLKRGLPVAYKGLPVYVTEFNHIWKTSEAVGDVGWVHNQNAAEVIAAAYGVALAKGIAGLAIYRWAGDEWAVDDNLTVLGTVRRLIEEVQGD